MTSSDAILHDHHARDEASDPRLNIVLEASAGTGKTRVLVDRYVRLLEAGVEPGNILTMTFTRKAAGEMKSRIIDELRMRPPLWEENRDHLFDMRILTIDAFCLGLLREFPLEAGLDPNIDLLDDVETFRLLEDAVDDALVHPRDFKGIDLGFLLSWYGEPAVRRGLTDLLRSRLVKAPLVHDLIGRYIPQHISVENSLARIARDLNAIFDSRDWNTAPLRLRHMLTSPVATAFDVEQIARVFLTQDGRPRKKNSPSTPKDAFPSRAAYAHHRTNVLSIAPTVAEIYRRWNADRERYASRELWSLYRHALQHYASSKDARDGLDFTDILIRATELLEERDAFSQSRFRLESRYHHMLIDEFQDTNFIQWRLVRALIDAWGEGAGLVHDAILAQQAAGRGKGRICEPSIFIVADRKQSIYGWRDARVEVVDRAAQYIMNLRPQGGREVTIRQSFRADSALLSFLNDVFSRIPKADAAVHWAFRYGEQDHFPITAVGEQVNPVGMIAASDLPSAADSVADEIVRLLRTAPLRPQDIAVLFRSRTHYGVYEEALARRGVPILVYRGLGFFDSPEVRDLLALVRYLAEPTSELRAAELLRSRLIGFSDTGLSLLASLRTTKSHDGPLARFLKGTLNKRDSLIGLSAEDAAVASEVATLVPGWLQQVDQCPPTDLIEQILDEMEYASWFAGYGGSQGWENVKKILELIRRAQNRGYLTFTRLADYLEHASAGEESQAVLEAADAVNLMTVHAAKGLEFHTVFVVNLDQNIRSHQSIPRLRERHDGTVELDVSAAADAHAPDRAVEEEKRLLYVALTRAKRTLILSSTMKAPRNEPQTTSFFQLLPESLRELFRRVSQSDVQEIIWKPGEREHRVRIIRPARERKLYSERARQNPQHRLALSPLADTSPPKVAASEVVRTLIHSPSQEQTVNPLDIAVGKTVHKMFEYTVPLNHTVSRVAEALFPDCPGATPLERRNAAREACHAYRVLCSQQELRNIRESGEVSHEVPFAFARNGVVVRGVIDALIVRTDGVVVIDYKSGTYRAEHRAQMRIYLDAVATIFQDRPVEGWLFYPDRPPIQVSSTALGGVAR